VNGNSLPRFADRHAVVTGDERQDSVEHHFGQFSGVAVFNVKPNFQPHRIEKFAIK
jgi:hypothetical protein